MSLLLVSMDNTIVNVALPSIRTDWSASVSDLQWTVDAYTLVLASLLMVSGSMGDRFGRRKVLLVGLCVFTTSSYLCSIAPGLTWLIAFRALQAIGGSMLNPVAMSIISNVFTERREHATAVGIWGATVGVSMGLGPVVGGLLIQTTGWRSVFWINLPLGFAAILLAVIFVPESRAPVKRRIDILGQILVIVSLATLTYAIIETPRAGWRTAHGLAPVVAAILSIAVLLVWENRCDEPLIELRCFRSAPFAGATVIAIYTFVVSTGVLFMGAMYLQDVRGYPPVKAGLYTLPLAVGTLIFAPVSGRLVGRYGNRIPFCVGGICMLIGAALLFRLSDNTSMWLLSASFAFFGSGLGLVNAPITSSAMSGLPASRAGVAAAIASASRQVGAALGVATVGSIVNMGLHGRPMRTGFSPASHPAWILLATMGLGTLVVGWLVSGRWALSTASRVRVGFETPMPAPTPNAAAHVLPVGAE